MHQFWKAQKQINFLLAIKNLGITFLSQDFGDLFGYYNQNCNVLDSVCGSWFLSEDFGVHNNSDCQANQCALVPVGRHQSYLLIFVFDTRKNHNAIFQKNINLKASIIGIVLTNLSFFY